MLLRQVTALINRQAQLRKQLTEALFATLLLLWIDFRSWDDPDVVEANVARTAYEVEKANLGIRQVTRSYFRNYFTIVEGKSGEPPSEIENPYPRDGVSAHEVYTRVVDEYFYTTRKLEREREELDERIESAKTEIRDSISTDIDKLVKEVKEIDKKIETPEERREGKAAQRAADFQKRLDEIREKEERDRSEREAREDEESKRLDEEIQRELESLRSRLYDDTRIVLTAQARAAERLDKLADMDLQTAMREETERALNANEVLGFRRIIHPELSESGVCGTCVAAASRRYKRGDLNPIHYYCKCEVAPITKDHDPGLILNDAALKRLYEEAGGNDIDALSNTRYKTNEHGELGLVLTENKNAPALTPSERRSRNHKDRLFQQKRDIGELNTLYKSSGRLNKRYRDGETNLVAPLQWTELRIKQLEKRMSDADKAIVREGRVKTTERSGASNSRESAATGSDAPMDKDQKREYLNIMEESLQRLKNASEEDLRLNNKLSHSKFTNVATDRKSAIKFHETAIKRLRKELGL